MSASGHALIGHGLRPGGVYTLATRPVRTIRRTAWTRADPRGEIKPLCLIDDCVRHLADRAAPAGLLTAQGALHGLGHDGAAGPVPPCTGA